MEQRVRAGEEHPRGRWGRLARRLGLVPVRTGRIWRRVRWLVGERNGYLVAISPEHSLRRSSVDILVRFPLESTVRGMREDVMNEAAVGAAFGRKKGLPRSRRRDLLVGDGAILLRLPYGFFPPRASRIERVTDGLVEALSHHMRSVDVACEMCLENRTPRLYVADGLPVFVCEACVEKFEAREGEFATIVRTLEPDYARGLTLGVAGACAFGIAIGALAALPRIVLPDVASYVALPSFAALGFLVSGVASRGLSGERIPSLLLKLLASLLGALVAFTTMNAVTTMTIKPQPVDHWLLWASSWMSLVANPIRAALLGGAAAVGWLLEVASFALTRRRSRRRTKLVRVLLEPLVHESRSEG